MAVCVASTPISKRAFMVEQAGQSTVSNYDFRRLADGCWAIIDGNCSSGI